MTSGDWGDMETMVPDDLRADMMRVSELVPYAGNAKRHPDWQVGQIASSIRAFGFNDPIAVWQDVAGHWVVVEGHGRLLAAKELGMDEVPVIRLSHLDDEARRAYTLAHNKLTMNTDFDAQLLDFELDAIEGFDMAEFGFEVEDVAVVASPEPQEGVTVTVRFPDRESYEGHRAAFSEMEEGGAAVAVAGAS